VTPAGVATLPGRGPVLRVRADDVGTFLGCSVRTSEVGGGVWIASTNRFVR
jgi:hypothetical protein